MDVHDIEVVLDGVVVARLKVVGNEIIVCQVRQGDVSPGSGPSPRS